MADEDVVEEEGGKKKSKLMLIIIIVVVLLAGGGAAAFFLMGSDEPAPAETAEGAEGEGAEAAEAEEAESASVGSALYVQMPRPLTFNVPGDGRGRMVEIRVQLMVRGLENEELAKMHIPSIQGTLLAAFSSSNAEDLVTEAGKAALRDQALRDVQATMKEMTGNEVVEKVLFTGFVLQ